MRSMMIGYKENWWHAQAVVAWACRRLGGASTPARKTAWTGCRWSRAGGLFVLAAAPLVVGLVAMAAAAPAPAPATPPASSTAPAAGPRDCAPGVQATEEPGGDPVAQALRHYVRGRIFLSNREYVAAAAEFRQAAALEPKAHEIWFNLGLALYEMGNVTGAVEAFEKSLALDPAHAGSLFWRGRIAASVGELKPAVDYLTRLTTSARKNTAYYILGTYSLAKVCQDFGDIEGAIKHYEMLLASLAEPQSFFQRYPELFLLYRNQVQMRETLADLLIQRHAPDRAVEVLRAALSERPDIERLLDLMCAAHLQKKDYPAARQWAKRIIDIHPDAGAGYQRLAEVYRAEGKPDAVIPELEAYRRDHPENRTLAFQLASAYEAAGRKDDAAAVYRELSSRPDRRSDMGAQAALKLADIQVQEGRFVEAIETLGGALSGEIAETKILMRAAQVIDGLKDPVKVYAGAKRLVADDQKGYGPFVLVGMLAEVLKRYDEAMALYDKALDRQPRAGIAYSRKANLLIDAGRNDDALAVYQAATRAGLNLPAFRRKMGMLLEDLGRFDEALAEYRLARQGDPGDLPTRYLLADLLARQGKFDEAERELRTLINGFPREIQGYCQLAFVYMKKGDLEAAEKILGQAQALDAGAVGPKALLAEVRFRQKRYDDTVKLAREILAAHADDHEVRLFLAQVLAATRQFKEAVTEVRTLLVAQPENITWWYVLAGIYSEMGDAAAAEQALQRILKKKPDHAPSNNDLGYMWADRGVNLAQAEEMIRQALKADPQRAAYLDSLGWIMYKTGRFEDAVKALEDATRRSPDLDALLWDHLGDAYWQLKRQDDAVKAWQTAARILGDRGPDAKAGERERVEQKVRQSQAGTAPAVAPVVPKPEIGKGEANPREAPSR
jgi:tetratricopeptide (TPR) repeat protein